MIFHQGTAKDMKHLFDSLPCVSEDGVVYYDGFDLMRPSFFEQLGESNTTEHGCNYIVATNDNGLVQGVLKTKRYGLPHHEFVEEKDASEIESYVAIRFIDVHKTLRNTGVTKQLIRFWSSCVLRANDSVVGGKSTGKGERINIHRWLNREIDQVYAINEQDLVYDWLEEHEYDYFMESDF